MERFFHLSERGTSVRREVVAGFATFMTMAYIIVVNPLILSAAGMPIPAVTAATCLGAAIPTILLGLWTNYPLALASGMGLNAAVALQATQPGMTWQTMMGVIVIEGIIILLLVLSGTREQVMAAVPRDLKLAIGVGIGLFIAFLGLQQMGWVAKGPGPVFLKHGDFQSTPVLVATIGLLIMIWLLSRRVAGTIFLGILATACIAAAVDIFAPSESKLVRLPESIVSVPDFSTFGQADLPAAFRPALAATIFAFLITDFFDTMGTVIAIGSQGKFLDGEGRLPRLKRVLLVDSFGAIWGGLCGASSATTYIESAAGVSEGGRTGLVAVVVGILFLLAMFFSPIFAAIPAIATAPALLLIGYLMAQMVHEIDFKSIEEGLPAFLTLLLIPLTQSISTGIGIGMIAYVAVKAFRGKVSEVPPAMLIIALVFLASFAFQK